MNKEVLAIGSFNPESGTEMVRQTHVVSADATDINALHQLGVVEFGSAVVGKGTPGAFVLITATSQTLRGSASGEALSPRTRFWNGWRTPRDLPGGGCWPPHRAPRLGSIAGLH